MTTNVSLRYRGAVEKTVSGTRTRRVRRSENEMKNVRAQHGSAAAYTRRARVFVIHTRESEDISADNIGLGVLYV